MAKKISLSEIDALFDQSGSAAVGIAIDPKVLRPSADEVARYFGGPDYLLNDKTLHHVEQGIEDGAQMVKPVVAYRAQPVEDLESDIKNRWTDQPYDQIFDSGVEVHARYLAVYVGTLGSALETMCRELSDSNRMYQALLMDSVGTAMLDRLGSICNDIAELHAKKLGLFSGCRKGPGLNGISLESHSLLFDLLGGESAGVQLNEAFVMEPAKSISAFILYSHSEQQRKPGNKCRFCTMKDCQFRSTRHH